MTLLEGVLTYRGALFGLCGSAYSSWMARARIKPERPPKYIVIVDTNILWAEDKSIVAAPDFDAFWAEFSALFDLELVIPEVVKGELLFQQTTSALKALAKATAAFRDLALATGKPYAHRVTPEHTKSDVSTRFDAWLRENGGRIERTPYDQIQWDRIAHCAIWREPPFEYDPKNADNEKGFRDALILETVCAIAQRAPTTHVAILCNDRMLSDAIKLRLNTMTRRECYPTVEDFAAYLKLTKEERTDAFVRQVRTRATRKFYDRNNDKCLYVAQNVSAKIQEKFPGHFEPPMSGSLSVLTNAPSWEPSGDEVRWITPARFSRVESERWFHWNSVIKVVQMFKPVQKQVWAPSSQVRIMEFNVEWRAAVGADGSFRSPDIVDITFVNQKFGLPTAQERKEFSLPEPEPIDPALLAAVFSPPSLGSRLSKLSVNWLAPAEPKGEF